MAVRTGVGVGMLVLPTVVGLGLDTNVDPLHAMLDAVGWSRWVLYPALVGVGMLLYRSTVRERDHEHRRSTTLHRLRHVFRAEDEGLWEASTPVPQGESPTAMAGERVGGLTTEGPERETGEEVDVTTLTGHRFTVEGDDVERSVGAVVPESPMDRLIDGVQGFFSGDSGSERRAERRRQQLEARADADPIRAARPIAPLPDDVTPVASEGLSTASVNSSTVAWGGASCSVCGAAVRDAERFCPSCGSSTA